MRKWTRSIASGVLSATMVLSGLGGTVGLTSVYAADKDAAQKTVNISLENSQYAPASKKAQKDIIALAEELPDKIDLRNYNGKNYVTPVKLQNPFGTCWSFAITAAAEISYLYENDLGVPAGEVNNNVDFSEKGLAWYYYNGLTKDDVLTGVVPASQVGEGYDISAFENKNDVYDIGGKVDYASNFYMSGMGPMSEWAQIDGTYPYVYMGKNGWVENEEGDEAQEAARRAYTYNKFLNDPQYIKFRYQLFGYTDGMDYDTWFDDNYDKGNNLKYNMMVYPNYAAYDDWTLPLNKEYRFGGIAATVKSSNILPTPALYGDGTIGEQVDSGYTFNEAGVAAIKSEIANGRGVAIAYFSDQSKPNQEVGDEGYINTTTWAQYTNEEEGATHGVCIVGYDDNYDKSNFTRTVDGKTVEGSTPPADGAFIVKNSWGAITAEDEAAAVTNADGTKKYTTPNARAWGIDDTGYFYLSYYDKSIRYAESYEFYTEDEAPQFITVNQYDFMPVNLYTDISVSEDYEYRFANVFTAEEDYNLTSVAAVTIRPETTVEYTVYMNPETGKPDSGVEVASGGGVAEFGGYQRFNLDTPVLRGGKRDIS